MTETTEVDVPLPQLDSKLSRNIGKRLKLLKYTHYACTSEFLKRVFKDDLPLIKELFDAAQNTPKVFQVDELVKGYAMLEQMREEFLQTGKLHPAYATLQKNIIALTDKMRKQDEGIRIEGEIFHVHDDIRRTVEIQMKRVTEGNDADREQQRAEVRRSLGYRKDTELA